MIPLQMIHLPRMTTELWHHAGPEHNVRLRRKYKGQSPTYSPHANRIAIGIQRCEILAEFFPSYLKVSEDYERHSQDSWRTSSSRLAEFASSSSATRRHAAMDSTIYGRQKKRRGGYSRATMIQERVEAPAWNHWRLLRRSVTQDFIEFALCCCWRGIYRVFSQIV